MKMSRRRGPHGDNLRKKGKDGKFFNREESWERSYRGVKKKYARVRAHRRGGRIVKAHIRRLL